MSIIWIARAKVRNIFGFAIKKRMPHSFRSTAYYRKAPAEAEAKITSCHHFQVIALYLL